jgi:predicted TIM-barrel fold metal-dependent hydrolase
MVQRILSADSHVLEPPDLWTTRMQPRFRDRAPHLEHEFNGQTGDFLVCDPLRPFNPTSLGCAGIPPAELEKFSRGGYAVCRPGSWDPVERLKDMDADGLAGEIFYCGYSMSLFSHPDEEFQRDAHRAYNDWAAEYASHAPRRLFPVANISMTDPEADLSELYRVRQLGFRGIFISNDPLPERRYDNPMWDAFWTAVEDYDMPVNIHILTRQGGPQVGANQIVDGVVLPVPAFRTIAEMITGGVLDKHPRLKVISVENDIGWMPNYLKRLEWYSYRFGPRFPKLNGQNAADIWRRQVYATFQDDVPGIRCRDLIGVDNLMWGSDYPHFDSTFPKSQEAIERNFEGVPESERELILGENMVRVYDLEGLLARAPESAVAATA